MSFSRLLRDSSFWGIHGQIGRQRLGAGCRLSETQNLDQVLTCSGSTPRLWGGGREGCT